MLRLRTEDSSASVAEAAEAIVASAVSAVTSISIVGTSVGVVGTGISISIGIAVVSFVTTSIAVASASAGGSSTRSGTGSSSSSISCGRGLGLSRDNIEGLERSGQAGNSLFQKRANSSRVLQTLIAACVLNSGDGSGKVSLILGNLLEDLLKSQRRRNLGGGVLAGLHVDLLNGEASTERTSESVVSATDGADVTSGSYRTVVRIREFLVNL